MLDTKPLGELLVSKRLITQAQLAAALAEQRSTKEFLGTLLIRKGWLAKDALLQSLAEQLGIAYMHLDPQGVDWSVAAKFSPAVVQEHRCLPIAMDRQSVTVAVVNPLEVWGIGQIEQKAGGRRVRVVLVSEEEFTGAMPTYRQKVRAHAPGAQP